MKKRVLGIFCAMICAAAFAAPIAEVKYFYAKDGTLIGRAVNGVRQNYEYDRRGQLLDVVDAASGKSVESYRYDKAGNLLKKTVHGETTEYTYDAANQLTQIVVNGRVIRCEYDAAGRMIREGEKTYTYGYLDKILAIQENGRQTATFDYYVDGQLAQAVYGAKRETFQWDGLALISRNETTFINEPAITGGNPILSSKDGVMFNDMLGNTLGTKSADAFSPVNMTAFGEAADKSAMFTGKPYIGDLGYAFLFRNYRPELAKWQTADPLGYPDGWNNLAYVNNSVTSAIDYLGAEIKTDAKGLDYLDYGQWNTDVSVALAYLKTVPQINDIITSLESSTQVITIQQSDNWPQTSSYSLGNGATIEIDNKSYISSREYSFPQAMLWELMTAYARTILQEPDGEKNYTERNYNSLQKLLNPSLNPFPYQPQNVMAKPE